jgi:serine protease
MGPAEFEAALPEIVVDLGDEGRDPEYGFGLINANLAVSYAIEQAGEEVLGDPVLSVSSSVLDFGGSLTTLPFAIGNTGQGTLEITDVTSSADWLTIAPGAVGANTVTITPADLEEGANTATLTIESNGGTEVIAVRAFRGEEPSGGNVGVAYVLLVDPETGEAVEGAQTVATPEGEYSFEILNIPGGKYYLVAGTDLRDSFYVGNDGDVYGAFPLAQDPQLICRFMSDPDPECPQLTEVEQQDPNLSDVTIPMEYLLDLGAREQEEQDVEPAGYSPTSTPYVKPKRVRRR